MSKTQAMARKKGQTAEQTRFVILGAQRTGTILLMGLLDSHPQITCLGELFQHRADYVPHSVPRYRLYVTSSLRNRALDLMARKPTIHGYLDDVFAALDTPVIGFKLMLDQAKRFPMVLDFLKAHNFKIIHIVRENLLKTYISRLRARQTGVYLSTDSPERVLVHVPIESLVERLVALEKEHHAMRSMLSRLRLDSVTVSYENISGRSRGSEVARLLAFLGVDPDVRTESRSIKITPDDLGQVIANYEAVTTTLADTAYQRFLSYTANG